MDDHVMAVTGEINLRELLVCQRKAMGKVLFHPFGKERGTGSGRVVIAHGMREDKLAAVVWIHIIAQVI